MISNGNLADTNVNVYGDVSGGFGVVLRVPAFTFIDRTTYEDITFNTKGIVHDDFFKTAALSDRMLKYTLFTDDRVKHVIGVEMVGGDMCGFTPSLSGSGSVCLTESQEDADILAIFNDRLTKDVESDQSFYEILPVGDGDLLVIMENGFLNHITQSKITASAFVLLCLSQLDRFKVDKSRLNKLYLNLAFIDSYHLLLKARLG